MSSNPWLVSWPLESFSPTALEMAKAASVCTVFYSQWIGGDTEHGLAAQQLRNGVRIQRNGTHHFKRNLREVR